MLDSRSPRVKRPSVSSLLVSIVALGAFAGVSACGGGGSPSTNQPPPSTGVSNLCNSGTYSGTPPASIPQPDPFFGMHIHSLEPATPWPSTVVPLPSDPDPTTAVQFGGIRLWDSGVGWAEINTGAGACDFSHMDAFMAEAQANNVDVLYDLGRTPNWASSNPNDTNCAYTNIDGGPGQCEPPTDLNSDGTGADAIWIGWVTSAVSRYKGQIKFYEIWNEWNVSLFWVGTPQQLVRMTQDARCVIEGPPPGESCNSESVFPSGTALDPDARLSTPAPVGGQSVLNAVQTQMSDFLGTQVAGVGPASFVDIIGFHCYVSTQTSGDYPVPEDVLTVISDLNSVLPNFAVQSDPLFCTEGGWGQAPVEGFTDPDLQAGFLARYYLLQDSINVARVYWYAWDSPSPGEGALWSPGDPTKAATAYAEVYKWIAGNTPTGCSLMNGTTQYACGYSNGSYQALAVWDSNVSGNGTAAGSSCYAAGAPVCSTFTIPARYTMYRDLSGNENPVPGSTIPLSAKPILLETGPLP